MLAWKEIGDADEEKSDDVAASRLELLALSAITMIALGFWRGSCARASWSIEGFLDRRKISRNSSIAVAPGGETLPIQGRRFQTSLPFSLFHRHWNLLSSPRVSNT